MKRTFKFLILSIATSLLGIGSLILSSCNAIQNEAIVVNYLADAGGTIEGETSQKVFTWQNTSTVKAVSDEQHKFTNWTVDIADYEDKYANSETRTDSFLSNSIKEYNFIAHFETVIKVDIKIQASAGGAVYESSKSSSTAKSEINYSVDIGSNNIKVTAIQSKEFPANYYSFSCWKRNGVVLEDQKTNTLEIKNENQSCTYLAEFVQNKAFVEIVANSETDKQYFDPKDTLRVEDIDISLAENLVNVGIKIKTGYQSNINLAKWVDTATNTYYDVNNVDYGDFETVCDTTNYYYEIHFKKVTRNYTFKPIFQSTSNLYVQFKVAEQCVSYGYLTGMTYQNVSFQGKTTAVTASVYSTNGYKFYGWTFTDTSLNPLTDLDIDYNIDGSQIVIKNIDKSIIATATFKPSIFVKFELPQSIQKGYNGTSNDLAILEYGSDHTPYDGSIFEIKYDSNLPFIVPRKSGGTTQQQATFSFGTGWNIKSSSGKDLEVSALSTSTDLSNYYNISADSGEKKSITSVISSISNLGEINGTQNNPYIFVPRLETTRTSYKIQFTSDELDMGLITSPVWSVDGEGTDDPSQVQKDKGTFSKIINATPGTLFGGNFNENCIKVLPYKGNSLDYIYETNTPDVRMSLDELITKYKNTTITSDLHFKFKFKETFNDDDFSTLPELYSHKDSLNSLLKIILNGKIGTTDYSQKYVSTTELFNEVTRDPDLGKDVSPHPYLKSIESDDTKESLTKNAESILKYYSKDSSTLINDKGNLSVEFGGLKWHVVYFENIKKVNGKYDPIVTLWLAGQDGFDNTFTPCNSNTNAKAWPKKYNNTFLMDLYGDNIGSSVEKYGQIYSRISSLFGDSNKFHLPQARTTNPDDIQVPTNMYGRSSMSADTLSNGGNYYYWENDTAKVYLNGDSYENNPFYGFTYGKYSNFIDSPYQSSSYQDKQSMNTIFGSGSGYDNANDAYSLLNTEDNSKFFKNYVNFSNFFSLDNSNEWKDNKVWLPSIPEAANDGIWGTSKNQRLWNSNAKTFDMYNDKFTYWSSAEDLRYAYINYSSIESDTVTIDSTSAVPGTLLRSYKYDGTDSTKYMQTYLSPTDGNIATTSYKNVVGIRPCILLNLRTLYNHFI